MPPEYKRHPFQLHVNENLQMNSLTENEIHLSTVRRLAIF